MAIKSNQSLSVVSEEELQRAIKTTPSNKLRADFGTFLHNALQTTPVHLQIYSKRSEPVFHEYPGQSLVECSFVIDSFSITPSDGSVAPIPQEPMCITLTGFKKLHAAEAACRHLCRDGAEIVAVASAQFTAPNGEVVIPVRTTWVKPMKKKRSKGKSKGFQQ